VLHPHALDVVAPRPLLLLLLLLFLLLARWTVRERYSRQRCH
jgi:hypothetical protein